MTVSISFGGRDRELHFPLKEMRKLERQLDPRYTLNGVVRLLIDGSVEALTAVLWTGLKVDDPGLKLAKVQDWLDDYCDLGGADLGKLFRDVSEAITEANWFKQINGTNDARPTS